MRNTGLVIESTSSALSASPAISLEAAVSPSSAASWKPKTTDLMLGDEPLQVCGTPVDTYWIPIKSETSMQLINIKNNLCIDLLKENDKSILPQELKKIMGLPSGSMVWITEQADKSTTKIYLAKLIYDDKGWRCDYDATSAKTFNGYFYSFDVAPNGRWMLLGLTEKPKRDNNKIISTLLNNTLQVMKIMEYDDPTRLEFYLSAISTIRFLPSSQLVYLNNRQEYSGMGGEPLYASVLSFDTPYELISLPSSSPIMSIPLQISIPIYQHPYSFLIELSPCYNWLAIAFPLIGSRNSIVMIYDLSNDSILPVYYLRFAVSPTPFQWLNDNLIFMNTDGSIACFQPEEKTTTIVTKEKNKGFHIINHNQLLLHLDEEKKFRLLEVPRHEHPFFFSLGLLLATYLPANNTIFLIKDYIGLHSLVEFFLTRLTLAHPQDEPGLAHEEYSVYDGEANRVIRDLKDISDHCASWALSHLRKAPLIGGFFSSIHTPREKVIQKCSEEQKLSVSVMNALKEKLHRKDSTKTYSMFVQETFAEFKTTEEKCSGGVLQEYIRHIVSLDTLTPVMPMPKKAIG